MADDNLYDLIDSVGSDDPLEPACRLVDVTISHDDSDILDHVSVAFPATACTVIMGPSGSGKSTLLKAAAGLVVPSEGHVEILSTDPQRCSSRELELLRARNGFVFQDGALWQNMSLYQNLALPLQYHNPEMAAAEVKDRIDRLARELGATNRLELRPAQVSAGERKIVSFIRAIVNRPDIVFLDEPTTSVDSERAELMIRKMKELRDGTPTLITVTHDPKIASQVADYLLVIKQGRVLRFGTLHEVSRSEDPEVERILTDVLSQAATYDGDILELLNPDTNTFLTEGPPSDGGIDDE